MDAASAPAATSKKKAFNPLEEEKFDDQRMLQWATAHEDNDENRGTEGSLAILMQTFEGATDNEEFVQLGPLWGAFSALLLANLHRGVQGFVAAAATRRRIVVVPGAKATQQDIDQAHRFIQHPHQQEMPRRVFFRVDLRHEEKGFVPVVKFRLTSEGATRLYAARNFSAGDIVSIHVGSVTWVDPERRPREFANGNMRGIVALGYVRPGNLWDCPFRHPTTSVLEMRDANNVSTVGMGAHFAKVDFRSPNVFLFGNGFYIATCDINAGDELFRGD